MRRLPRSKPQSSAFAASALALSRGCATCSPRSTASCARTHESRTLSDARALIQQELAAALAADALAPCRKVIVELARAWTTRADVVADLDAELTQAARRSKSWLASRGPTTSNGLTATAPMLARSRLPRSSPPPTLSTSTEPVCAAGFERDQFRDLHASATPGPARVEQLAEHSTASIAPSIVRGRWSANAAGSSRTTRLAAPTAPSALARATARPARGYPSSISQRRRCRRSSRRALAATLAADADARVRRSRRARHLAAAEQGALVDRVLGQVIGSHDGKLFRSFAQSLTLDGLLAVANSHLEELAPRYQLERVPEARSRAPGDRSRPRRRGRSVQSLSGGESFLVSLALALGLSSMSAHDVRVRTLLIDEGFGTLDPATLDSALAVLDALQATGRQVGIISHVPALVERVGAHVRVIRRRRRPERGHRRGRDATCSWPHAGDMHVHTSRRRSWALSQYLHPHEQRLDCRTRVHHADSLRNRTSRRAAGGVEHPGIDVVDPARPPAQP